MLTKRYLGGNNEKDDSMVLDSIQEAIDEAGKDNNLTKGGK
jgi:hypothetical protein